MSDSSSDQAIAELLLAQIFTFQLSDYLFLSIFVLSFYDFFLTLPSEIRLIWSRQLTGSSVIFFLGRYSFLLSQMFQVFFQFSLPGLALTQTSCGDLGLMTRIATSVNDGAMKSLSILRVYALFGQKRSLLILICPFIIADVIGAILISSTVSAITTQGTYLEPIVPCLGASTSAKLFEFEIVELISPLLQLAFDTIIFILTLVKTAGHIMESRKSGIHSIAEVVLRDGSLYFLIIFIIASITAALGIASIFPNANVVLAAEISTMILDALTNILINHLVLNLRAFSNRTVQHSGKVPSNAHDARPRSALDFAENRFLGNIGAPLDYDQWDDMDELENEVEQGDVDGEWEIPDSSVDPLTTLVPVIYDHEKGAVRFVPLQREAGPRKLPS